MAVYSCEFIHLIDVVGYPIGSRGRLPVPACKCSATVSEGADPQGVLCPEDRRPPRLRYINLVQATRMSKPSGQAGPWLSRRCRGSPVLV